MLKFARRASWAGLCALLLASAVAASGQLGFSRSVTPGLITHYVGLFGPGARGRLEGWKKFVRGIEDRTAPARNSSGEIELLHLVNRFFNGVPSATDLALWGVVDYWATPSESLSIGGADCEDYAIAKYFTFTSASSSGNRSPASSNTTAERVARYCSMRAWRLASPPLGFEGHPHAANTPWSPAENRITGGPEPG